MTTHGTGGGRIQSDEKLFRIIELLQAHGGAGVTELAEEMDVAKSTIYRHLQTLVHHGYATKTDGEYHVGLRFLDHGIFARQQQVIFRAARERIDELADETGELVWCQTHENGQCVYLYGAAGRHSVYSPEQVGNRTAMHQLAGGKAMLAHLPEATVERILDQHGLPAATPHTITTREALFEELETIRNAGVAFNREESTEGLHAVAAPVRDTDGSVLGAIGISGPKNRLRGDFFERELPDLLLGTSNEIELNIAHQEFPSGSGKRSPR